MATLTLIRGLPGCGKSTLARTLGTPQRILEADMFFIDSKGHYTFNKGKLQEAHEWCQRETIDSLTTGINTVVANTFCETWELDPYLVMPWDTLVVIEPDRSGQSIHNIPDRILGGMKKRFTPYHKVIDYLLTTLGPTYCKGILNTHGCKLTYFTKK